MRHRRRAGILAVSVLQASLLLAAEEHEDKTLLFPAIAVPAGNVWKIPVHAWTFQFETESKRRALLLNMLARSLSLKAETIQNELFRQRAWYFLVKNIKAAQLTCLMDGRDYVLKPSLMNGHIHDTLTVPRGAPQPGAHGSVDIHINIPSRPGAENRVWFPQEEGINVISDIDDTIKITEVRKRRQMLANTFVKPYEAVPGMAALYQEWAKKDPQTMFYYTSASPWQLYPALSEFLSASGFPAGELRLKPFRWKDRSFFSLWQNPQAYKTPLLEEIFEDFPRRKFILVGDTGEKDPETYGVLARRHPQQIERILIHDIGYSAPGRFEKAFKDVSQTQWKVFRDPVELS